MAYEKKKDDSAQRLLREQIKNHDLQRLYVFHGEESYLKDFYKGEIEKQIGGSGFDEFNLIYLDGANMDEDAFNDAVESLPFGSEKKLVVIRDPEFSSWPARLKDALPEIFANLPEYLCMILLFQGIEYKPDKRQNLYKSIEKNGLAVEFSKAQGSELVKWLQRRFAANKKIIGPADCDYIIFLCGSLMTNLITEVDKISAYAKGDVISRADIDAVASRVLEADVFDLTDCIMKGDYKKAISILRDLMEMKNEPVAVLAALTRQTQRIYAASLARKAGQGESYIMNLYNFRSSYPARLLMQAAGRTTPLRAARALDLCCQADTELKSNIPDQQRVLELVILRMAQVR